MDLTSNSPWKMRRAVLSAGCFVVLVSACSDGVPVGPGTSAPTAVVAISGNGQSGTVGNALPSPLIVQVRNAANAGVPGVTVTWTASSGVLSQSTSVSDGSGNASVTWTLGTRAGLDTVRASIPGGTGVSLTARGTPDVAAVLSLSSDSIVLDRWGDTARINAAVVDRHGNELVAPTVNWASSDTSVATVAASGLVTSRRAGEVQISATAGSMSAIGTVTVPVQRNGLCSVPSAPTQRGAVGGMVSWSPQMIPGSEMPVTADTTLVGPLGMPVAVDLDADGDLDVFAPWFIVERPSTAIVTYAGAAAFRNDGATLVPATSQFWGDRTASWVYPRVMLTFDADGDGRKDILMLDTGYDPAGYPGAGCGPLGVCPGARNTLLLTTSGGLQEASERLTTNSPNSFSHAGSAADVDCDGDADFFEGTWGNASAPESPHLHINSGGGTFVVDDARLPAELTSAGYSLGYSGMTFCDIDRDGDPDLTMSHPGRRVRIAVNDGFGRFRLLPTSAIPEARGGDARTEYTDIRCADYDGDGWNDLVMPRHDHSVDGETVTILMNNRDATFRDVTSETLMTMAAENPNGWMWQSEVVDINGDGWPDVLMSSPSMRNRILYNIGGGRFQEYVFPSEFWMFGPGPRFAVADFTGDGRPDIYVFRHRYQHAVMVNR